MIKEIARPLFTVICDACGLDYTENGAYEGYCSPEDAMLFAEDEGWHEYNDKHYCSYCYDTVMEELDREIENTRLEEEHDYKQATR